MKREPKEFDPTTANPAHVSWMYNVIDELKGKTKEECKEYVQANLLPCSILVSHVQGDFNFANVIRSSNALGIGPIYYYGRRKYDKRAAMGTYHYSDVRYLSTLTEVENLKEQYSFVAIENVERTHYLNEFTWQTSKNPLIVVGGEADGIAPELLALCEYRVEIKQRGTVRSLNLATAAGIAMYDYIQKTTA